MSDLICPHLAMFSISPMKVFLTAMCLMSVTNGRILTPWLSKLSFASNGPQSVVPETTEPEPTLQPQNSHMAPPTNWQRAPVNLALLRNVVNGIKEKHDTRWLFFEIWCESCSFVEKRQRLSSFRPCKRCENGQVVDAHVSSVWNINWCCEILMLRYNEIFDCLCCFIDRCLAKKQTSFTNL